MPVRSTARRLWLGLSTLLGRRRGFFIPYRYAHRLVPPGGRSAYQPIEQLFEAVGGKFAAQLRALDEYADALRAIGRQPAPMPRWDQDWFPRLDAAMAYAIVRRHRPMRIVEVGSGHSTRFMARAVDDGGLATEILAIDPAPRAALRGLRAEWLAQTVPTCGLAPFRRLAAGDILFAVDQQQYLQGYLPILLLYLYVTNLNVAGGGLPILTGPGFVDQSNADQVAALVEAGTR